uniref:CCHC-type domain-containing protein n=1 Tax=Tanacetum cinerariifolium TaxID=118510 RepID=A0A699IHX1_TANCI|nr:hypothetical protein [Tanacetum cinerariifolium]
MWNDLILSHEGPSDTMDTKIAALRLKFNAFKALEGEKDRDSDVEKDTKGSNEFLADLNAEFHDRALLANQMRFYKRSRRIRSARKPMDKSNETCFACGKQGHFQKDYYKGKYKAFKAELTLLTKNIDVVSKNKSEKELVDKSFNWDDESLSSEDKGVTRVKAFMAIIEDEPTKGKTYARLYKCKPPLCERSEEQLAQQTSRKVTIDQLLTKQVPGDIVCTLGERGKRKETISSKEIIFTKGENSPSKPAPEVTKKESPVKAIKKKAQTKSSSVPDPSPDKKSDSSTEQILLTLMKEDCYNQPYCSICQSIDHLTKEHPEQVFVKKTMSLLKAQAISSGRALRILKPFIPFMYCGFNDHHPDEYEYCLGCDILGSIAHEPFKCDIKFLPDNKKPRIANQRSNEPNKKVG